MKIVGIGGSPRKNGNTDILLNEAISGTKRHDVNTEILYLRDFRISPCLGCFNCAEKGECAIKDDMTFIKNKMIEADGIIFATPVYFWSMSGQMKVFLDRTISLRFPFLKLANKVGGIITVAARRGSINVSNIFHKYFVGSHMLSVESDVDAFGIEKGDVIKDTYAMKSAFELGKQMVGLIDKNFTFPEDFTLPLYMHVAQKYKIDLLPLNKKEK
jgi:multimeric flavodoxin WrbA